jgi:WD40 repeat protein
LPLAHEISLKDHSKPVSALDLDPSGSRVVTGGYDYEMKLWDFNGMDTSLRPFRSLEPCGSYQVCTFFFFFAYMQRVVAESLNAPAVCLFFS